MARVQLVITLEGSQVNLAGPIHDKILCYGLLAMAQEILAKLEVKEPSKIIPVTGMPGLKPS
jgi:hypothetical protein